MNLIQDLTRVRLYPNGQQSFLGLQMQQNLGLVKIIDE